MKVVLVMAMTLDGKIGKDPDHFPDWTGSADKRLFADISKNAGVVIMGSKTFDTLKKPLPGRKTVVMTRNPGRASNTPAVVFSPGPPASVVETLRQEGYRQAVLAGGATINTLFARAGLIDEIVVTISPLVFGDGLSLFDGEVDLAVERVGQDSVEGGLLCLRYRVTGPLKKHKSA